MLQLLDEKNKMNPEKAVAVLRNKEGINNKAIGYGNEKALNQLLAHHGIVFKPEELKVWVSANPYQLGEFVAYDLNSVFSNRNGNPSAVTLSNKALNIAKDPFLETEAYKNYEAYRVLERKVEAIIDQKGHIDEKDLEKLTELNPNYWKAHFLTGHYFYQNKRYAKALNHFKNAATKEISTIPEAEQIAKYIKKSKRKLK